MKKNYLLLSLLLSSTVFLAQTNFNNGGGDNLWSNPSNWDNGLPSDTNDPTLTADATMDIDATIHTLSGGNQTLSNGAGTLTLSGSANGNALLSNGNLVINAAVNLAGTGGRRWFDINGTNNSLTFGPNSTLDLQSDGEARATDGSNTYHFNGNITGNSALRIRDNVTFGANANNSNFSGDITVYQTATVTVNTSGTGAFLSNASNLYLINTTANVTVNTAESFYGGIDIRNSSVLNLTLNANQSVLNTINIAGTAVLNLSIDPTVNNVYFANTSGNSWSLDGGINITGFVPGVVRFGTDNTGLTTEQLTQITTDGDGSGEALALDTDGYLVVASTLSNKDFEPEYGKRLSYPTVVTNEINFSKPQANVQVYNIIGKKILEVDSKNNNLQSLSTSELRAGLYLIVFNGLKTEKFIKK